MSGRDIIGTNGGYCAALPPAGPVLRLFKGFMDQPTVERVIEGRFDETDEDKIDSHERTGLLVSDRLDCWFREGVAWPVAIVAFDIALSPEEAERFRDPADARDDHTSTDPTHESHWERARLYWIPAATMNARFVASWIIVGAIGRGSGGRQ